MERYQRRYKEEDSQSNLTDPSIPQKIQEFILANPFPKDDKLHRLADNLGINADELEQYVYAFLTLVLAGGKSKGKDVKASEENINIGHKIEIEHCEYESDNKVVKAIQDILISKITNDHLSETETYYVDGVNFKTELEQEGK